MRQKLIEAYEYSPPPTPGYFNEAVNDIQAKMTKDGVMMTNISDISNTKNPKSTTNLNEVGAISFKNGMKMTNNAISGVDTISTTNLNNVGAVSFTSGSKLSPDQAVSNTTSVIGSTVKATSVATFPKKTTTPTKLATLTLSKGVWLINFLLNVLGINQNGEIIVARVGNTIAGAGAGSSSFLYTTQIGGFVSNAGPQAPLQGTFVYNQTSDTNQSLILYGYSTVNNSSVQYSSNNKNMFTATRLA
jgi:hypothetical protein